MSSAKEPPLQNMLSDSSIFHGERERYGWRSQDIDYQKYILRCLFSKVRAKSLALCKDLEREDFNLQATKETIPPKWYLAHTTWFFETFILSSMIPNYKEYNSLFKVLFNFYYNAVGIQFTRGSRGLLSRPTIDEILSYRIYIDQTIRNLMESCSHSEWPAIAELIEVGINHEEQHQELMLTDIKYSLSANPMTPAYNTSAFSSTASSKGRWLANEGVVYYVGNEDLSFSFDNESPGYPVYVIPFKICSKLVTNGEYVEFVEHGGYNVPRYWLSDGFETAKALRWESPMYWRKSEGKWYQFTLSGEMELSEDEPVTHLSFYEADAYARFRGKRLPTEAEWEVAATQEPTKGNFLESGRFHPSPSSETNQFFGDVWEWTSSSYSPYPGDQSNTGILGEYNGKFMTNQMVLRGGSCVTPDQHIRASYRNFFYPQDRRQFSGLRLAEGI